MATGVLDLERIIDEIKTGLRARLNTKIAAIQVEKADAVVLRPVDDAAYALQTLNDKVMAFDPFILIGSGAPPKTEGAGAATSKIYEIHVMLCFVDEGQDAQIARRGYRYSRALEETVESYFTGIIWGFTLTMNSLEPVQFKLMNSDNEYRAVGVSITVGIA